MPNRPAADWTAAPHGLPELLAPAGNLDALKVAVGNGADAVYLGAAAYNARSAAANFTEEEIAEGIAFAHQRSARVYLTLNTLIADDEGTAALGLACCAYTAGIDAIIVQDIGLAAVLRRILPDLPLFASTQMTIADAAGLQAVARLGFRRVILPRELSLAEIRALTAQARQLDLETEVFIHGALCIGYSGQCLLSSMIGGRSGNRGSCAQPCRLPWILCGPDHNPMMPDGTAEPGPEAVRANPAAPWLSPRDQAMPDYLPELVLAGITSCKIEGRMRSSAYVGQTVAVYRAILDGLSAPPENSFETDPKISRRLLQAFNRGGSFTDRYISGRPAPGFLTGSPVGSHGLFLGLVSAVEPQRGILQITPSADWPPEDRLGRGDILAVRRTGEDQELASAPIGGSRSQGGFFQASGFHPDVLARLRIGDLVYRMTDHLAEQRILRADLRRTPVTLDLLGSVNALEPVRLTATALFAPGEDPAGLSVTASQLAESVPVLFPDRAEQQLQKTGGTPFRITEVRQAGAVHLSIASLNVLRRQVLHELAARLAVNGRRCLPAGLVMDWPSVNASQPASPKPASPSQEPPVDLATDRVTVYWHRMPENPAEMACGAEIHYLPIMSLDDPDASGRVEILRRSEPGCRILAWLPPAVSGPAARLLPELLDRLPDWGLDGICAGNPGLDLLVHPASPDRKLILAADTSANIFNQETLRHYAAVGAQSACLSLELSGDRLLPLLDAADKLGISLELPLYGRLRLMTSRFCPVGQNLPGCRRCRKSGKPAGAASLFSLEDRLHQVFYVLPQPRACGCDLFSHFLLSAAAEVSVLLDDSRRCEAIATPASLPNPGRRLRLFFLQETPAERRTLTTLAHQLLQAPDPLARVRIAGQFLAISEQIANRLNCRLGRGYYAKEIQRPGGKTRL